jgi:hypothetical protein
MNHDSIAVDDLHGLADLKQDICGNRDFSRQNDHPRFRRAQAYVSAPDGHRIAALVHHSKARWHMSVVRIRIPLRA